MNYIVCDGYTLDNPSLWIHVHFSLGLVNLRLVDDTNALLSFLKVNLNRNFISRDVNYIHLFSLEVYRAGFASNPAYVKLYSVTITCDDLHEKWVDLQFNKDLSQMIPYGEWML